MRSSEIREMAPEEMKTRLEDLQEELRGLRFGHVMQQVSNPLEIKAVRRDIARLKTIIAEENSKAAVDEVAGPEKAVAEEAVGEVMEPVVAAGGEEA